MPFLTSEIDRAYPISAELLATCLRRTHLTARLSNHIGRICIPLAYDYFGIDRSRIINDSPAMHMAYTTMHQLELVSSFMATLPADRKHLVRFEDVISTPGEQLDTLCQWLGVTPSGIELPKTVDPARAASMHHEYDEETTDAVRALLAPFRHKLGYQ